MTLAGPPLGSTLFHPTLPQIITCSGTRSFSPRTDSDDEDEEEETPKESSFKIWGLPN